ncbi:hypothetical protein K461DRAFT_145652 [Myriangium duriaei CBS 260.36]|uniref:Uncharacterized protein n=1 Tax=Myriangium duriaei CBS 260.36 TaxID=1168546 RepID=A0A9P4J2Q0_9PEZI|nr:hypothetical protein K461DRAFT_145652 [Myriangium duriaei CBS 260.36]
MNDEKMTWLDHCICKLRLETNGWSLLAIVALARVLTAVIVPKEDYPRPSLYVQPAMQYHSASCFGKCTRKLVEARIALQGVGRAAEHNTIRFVL